MVVFNIFRKLENTDAPLLGPSIFWLKFWCLLKPKRKCNIVLHNIFIVIVMLFGVTEYIEMYVVQSDLNMLINNFKITMTATVSFCKIMSFYVYQNDWVNVLEYANRTEIRDRIAAEHKPQMKLIIMKYTKYCRNINYMYWILVVITVFIVMVQPLLKYAISTSYRENVKNGIQPYDQMMSSWVPWDRNTPLGYAISYCYQALMAVYSAGLLMSFDTSAIALMVFFGGQVDLLKCRCMDIFYDEDVAKDMLKECHLIHLELLKYAEIFNSLLSPIMFLYTFVCSVMLCSSAYQIMLVEADLPQRIMTAEYLIFGIAQLFVYSWHSNEVFHKSQNLMHAPFESNWYINKTSLGNDLMVLAVQLKKDILFTAGPFAGLTIYTFINILKGAYSYYTLLSQSKQKPQ